MCSYCALPKLAAPLAIAWRLVKMLSVLQLGLSLAGGYTFQY